MFRLLCSSRWQSGLRTAHRLRDRKSVGATNEVESFENLKHEQAQIRPAQQVGTESKVLSFTSRLKRQLAATGNFHLLSGSECNGDVSPTTTQERDLFRDGLPGLLPERETPVPIDELPHRR